ncbi:MAG: ADOP family duplicated permease [Bryobacteraceae bacterium]
MLTRNLGFTCVAVLALGLGIGVNTAVFTGYKAMVARPLDARAPGEMVNIALMRNSSAGDPEFSYPDYVAYRDSAHSFSGLIAYSPEHMTLQDTGGVISQRDSAAGSLFGKLALIPSRAGKTEFASVYVVSENYFQVLGVGAARGRSFDAFAGAPGARELVVSPSVLISENYWQSRYAGDPAVLGKSIRLNGAAVTVAGIAPRDFVGTNIATPDFWLPVSLEPLVHADPNWLGDRDAQRYRIFGRLAPGVSMRQAQAEITLLSDRVRKLHDPQSEAAKLATAMVWPGSPFPLPIKSYGALNLAILLIMLAAAMLLAVACANVGSLQLARARSRQNELRMRLSLGASRRRLIRQLLTESALLGLLAGAVALLFTWALLKIAATFLAEGLPAEYGSLIFHVTPDLGIFSYVFAISLMAGILFGLAPAVESSRSALSLGERSSTSPVQNRRIQDFLIAAQAALSLVLMIAGSMLIHSAIHSLQLDPGYDSKHVVDLDLQFPERYTAARKLAVVRELRTRLARLPGVAQVTSVRPPLDDLLRTAAISVDASLHSAGAQAILCYNYVEPNYFETLGIPMLLGRTFQQNGGEAEHDVIVSESAAKQLFGGQNPLGRSIRLGITDERVHNRIQLSIELSHDAATGLAYRVVGVARDTRGAEFDGSDSKRVYLRLADERLADRPILIRTQSDPGQVIGAIDPLISSIDPDLAASSFTLDAILRRAPPFITASLAAAIASTLGGLGLLLASMGIYGTVSYIVLSRTREVGIRMAIGAQKRDILRLILGESTRPVMAGLAAGMILAVGASELLRGVLYGLNAVDGIAFVGVSLLFLAIALLAAYPPARRAMRVDPSVALRYE